MARVVLIPCCGPKLPHEAEAQDLYNSPLFRLSLAYARKLEPDAIYILSAKYGLLDLHARVEPYDVTLNGVPSVGVREWAAGVLQQLGARSDVQRDHYVVLAGASYRGYLTPHLAHHEVPLEGLRIGEQLRQLRMWLDE